MNQFGDSRSICEIWNECERELGLSSDSRVVSRGLDPFRRVYIDGERVIKVEFWSQMYSATKRRCNLSDEFNVYRACKNTRGVGRVIELRESTGYTALYLETVYGEPFDVDTASWTRTFAVVIQLLGISMRLAKHGIAHNDFVPSNILVSANGKVTLIDFDQATITNQLSAISRGVLGFPDKEEMVTFSVFYVLRMKIRAFVLRYLPDRAIICLRKLKSAISGQRDERLLPKLPKNATNRQIALLEAWKIAQRSMANAPGAGLAYYELEVDGICFPGERPWEDRWQVLNRVTSYDGKRVLELGCNMGLLSSYLMKYGGAQAALAVDVDNDILKAAREVSNAMQVRIEFSAIDFDSDENWEKQLERFEPDIVFALNVLNWVSDKTRFLNFLSRFEYVVFEGHDDFNIEKERLNSVGFRQVDLISISERDRPLMFCRK